MAKEASKDEAGNESESSPDGPKVRVWEEREGGLMVRRRVTEPRPLGGWPLLLMFVLGLIVMVAAMVFPEHHTVAVAVLLVLVLSVVMRVLNFQYEREVETRIEVARDEFRTRSMRRRRRQRAGRGGKRRRNKQQ